MSSWAWWASTSRSNWWSMELPLPPRSSSWSSRTSIRSRLPSWPPSCPPSLDCWPPRPRPGPLSQLRSQRPRRWSSRGVARLPGRARRPSVYVRISCRFYLRPRPSPDRPFGTVTRSVRGRRAVDRRGGSGAAGLAVSRAVPDPGAKRPDQLKRRGPLVGRDEDARDVPSPADHDAAGPVTNGPGLDIEGRFERPLAQAGLRPEGGAVADDEQPPSGQSDRAADRRNRVGQTLGRGEGRPQEATCRPREKLNGLGRWLHQRSLSHIGATINKYLMAPRNDSTSRPRRVRRG